MLLKRFGVFQKHFICKEKCGRSFMIYEKFNLELFYSHGTVILKIKSQVWTSFESLASKKAKTWRLKGTSR